MVCSPSIAPRSLSPVPMEKMQSIFRCTVKQDDVARSNLCPTFKKQKLSVLIQEQPEFVDHTEIDCDDLFMDMPDLQAVLPELEDSDEDVNNPKYEADDIQNIYADCLDIDWDHPADTNSESTLKGYEYTPFEATDAPQHLIGHICTSLTLKEALAITDFRPNLQPK